MTNKHQSHSEQPGWKPDKRNLMGIRPLGEAADAVPPSVKLVRDDVRSRVRNSMMPDTAESSSPGKLSLPPYPRDSIRSAEDIFSGANAEVDRIWTAARIDELIKGKCREWQAQLTKRGQKELREALGDSEAIMEGVRCRYLGDLEGLRTALPDAWDTLIALSSERLLQTQMLLREWTRNLPADEEQRIGLSKAEMQLFLDSALLQKFMDTAYAKQRWLTDLPGGTRTTKLGRDPQQQTTAPWVYEVIQEAEGTYRYAQNKREEKRTETRGMGTMFTYEWSHLTRRIQQLADATEESIREGKLPAQYKTFVSYLRKLHAFFQAQEQAGADADTSALNRMMDEVQQEGVKAYRDGCKIVLIPETVPTVAGDANKQDIGMRFGLVTPKIQAMSTHLDGSRIAAERKYRRFIGENEERLLSLPARIPPVLLSQEIFGAGPNLHFRVGGTNHPRRCDVHPDFIRDDSKEEREKLAALFPELGDVTAEAYGNEAVQHYANHEEAHSCFATEDPKTTARIGLAKHGEDVWILEEAKAEAEATAIRMAMLEQEQASSETIRAAFAVKLGAIVTLVTTFSDEGGSERYLFSGLYLLKKLLDENVIVRKGKGYRITDPLKGLRVLADTGDDIITRYYADPDADPDDVAAFVQAARAIRNDRKVKQFIASAKALEASEE